MLTWNPGIQPEAAVYEGILMVLLMCPGNQPNPEAPKSTSSLHICTAVHHLREMPACAAVQPVDHNPRQNCLLTLVEPTKE
jgi:hypothetical protein